MKQAILTALGTIGSFIAFLLGGWDASVITLLIFMLVDYITGIICAIFHKSKKTENGNLSSRVGWKGLCKKFITLLFIIVAVRLDLIIGGGNIIRDAVCVAFITNELISIVENAGLMGVPIPKVITNAIAVLNKKDDEKDI